MRFMPALGDGMGGVVSKRGLIKRRVVVFLLGQSHRKWTL